MKYAIPLLLVTIIFFQCKQNDMNDYEKVRKEIIQLEKDFAELVKKEGMKTAFLHFAAENAVLNRQNTLIKGKKEIEKYFTENETSYNNLMLSWIPEHVEISESMDLAYTYGEYELSFTDDSGINYVDKGVFHTVWKKQADGSWRYTWD